MALRDQRPAHGSGQKWMHGIKPGGTAGSIFSLLSQRILAGDKSAFLFIGNDHKTVCGGQRIFCTVPIDGRRGGQWPSAEGGMFVGSYSDEQHPFGGNRKD